VTADEETPVLSQEEDTTPEIEETATPRKPKKPSQTKKIPREDSQRGQNASINSLLNAGRLKPKLKG
jgi:hypothetical protein